MNRWKIAQYIALGATALSILGFCLQNMAGLELGTILMGVGFVTGFVSYVFGGLLTAVRMAAGIARWGWLIVPFPFDLVTFAAAFAFALMVFIYLPIIPVRKAYKESVR